MTPDRPSPSPVSMLRDLLRATPPPDLAELATWQKFHATAAKTLRQLVGGALLTHGTVEGAASSLGLTRRTLFRWLAEDPTLRPDTATSPATP